MKIIKLFPVLIALFAIHSCFPADEDPVSIPPISGAILEPEVGGANEPNQVWIKLSDSTKNSFNKRTDWDLAFYSGDEFRVTLNYSVALMVGKIPNATDIDSVTEADISALKNKVIIDPQNIETEQYIDDPTGNFLTQTTGIAEISANDNENPIYLVNMGFDVPTLQPNPGNANTTGSPRGWKKIQILRAPNGYKIKYADAGSTTHNEFVITKNPDYNFTFFSMISGETVNIQPKKKNWDMVFTLFLNHSYDTAGNYVGGTYFYNDYILTNTLDGVGAYYVNIPENSNADEYYNNFKLQDVDASKFIFNDQRAIGENWRTVVGANGVSGAFVYSDRFFVIKDSDGFLYKLRFNKMMNNEGERGYPQFEYEAL